MRDDKIRRILTTANPWWRAAAAGGDVGAWAGSHRALRDRARWDLGYRSPVLQDVATETINDALVVLTGPVAWARASPSSISPPPSAVARMSIPAR